MRHDQRADSILGSGAPAAEERDDRIFRLLRFSHIFASAVRELLEAKLLEETVQGLTRSQFHLLKLIVLNGPHQVGEMADFLGVSPPAASKTIDKLEQRGLLVRTPSTEDRRVTLLSASPAGRELVEEFERSTARRLQPVLDKFRREEVDELSQLLERFSVRLYQLEETRTGMCLRCAAYCVEQCPVAHVHNNCPYQRLRGRDTSARAAEERS